MPLVDQSPKYSYSGYELDDIERDQEPYFLAADVLERFFDGRDVLKPQPDWLEGQFHFEASAQELQYLVEESLRADGEEDAKVRFAANSASDIAWYLRTENATKEITRDRPIFVSLYEIDETVRIDGEARIIQALATDPSAKLPVVFVFNKIKEIALDQLVSAQYPVTIRGVRDAYVEKNLMLTPVPEWDLGEHHLQAKLIELDELFELPREEDFEPEYWQKLLDSARQYSVPDTSFLIAIMPNASRDEPEDEENQQNSDYSLDFSPSINKQVAAWDNPRSEEAFPYVKPGSGDNDEYDDRGKRDDDQTEKESFFGDGLILNRPDLVAAL